MFILKPHSGVPIYRQLLDQIRRMAASGQLPPGTELPSIRDLALKHAINPMTVSKVYALLEAEGVLERNRGKPMTIAKPARAQSPVGKRLEQLPGPGRHFHAGHPGHRSHRLDALHLAQPSRDGYRHHQHATGQCLVPIAIE